MKHLALKLALPLAMIGMHAASARQTLYVGVAGSPPAAIGISLTTGQQNLRITGAKTGIAGWAALADATGRTYVVTPGSYHGTPGKVSIFAPHARGNVAPKYEITCGSLTRAWDAEFDSAGRLYVTRSGGVSIFSPADRGCVKDHRSIEGSATGLVTPTGIAVDASDKVYVSDFAGAVAVFAPGASGNVSPIRLIKGSHTGLSNPEGVAVDEAGFIYVTNYSGDSVEVFSPLQNGDVTPVRTISGSRTLLNVPVGVRVAADGKIYVSNYGGDITVYRPSAKGNARPIRRISIAFPFELHLHLEK